MWQYGGLRAARSRDLPALWALLAVQLLCAQARAQEAATLPPPAPDPDVVRAAPPEPPQDSALPAVRDKPKPSAAKPAKPAAKKAETPKPAPSAPSAQSAPLKDPALGAAAEPQPTAASLPSEPAATSGAPLGPPDDADFGSAPAPQDDFAGDVQEARRGFRRELSVRIDTLNWLLLGRLSVELEMSVFKYLTVSMTPVFVTHTAPIAINYAGVDDPLKQHSNGLGPISGVSLGVGAWFWGEPFRGYVLRLELTNYGYNYRTKDGAGTIDSVDFTERRLILFVGSHSRFGAFTFAGGFGLGYELHQVERCGLTSVGGGIEARGGDCKGKQLIALDRQANDRADLNGPLHPVYFQARFSLGVVF